MNSNVFVNRLLLAIKRSVVVNRYLKLGGRAIITCNVDLVSSTNRDIAGLCTEASAEDGLFLELKGHRGLPSWQCPSLPKRGSCGPPSDYQKPP